MNKKQLGSTLIRFIAMVLLLCALRKNPYGYYILLRWVVCPIFAYSALRAYEKRKESWVWIFGVNAAIYNPIFPLHLSRSIWTVVNVISVVLIVVSLFTLKQND